jgi:predicted nucleic acid-binding protein
VSATLLVDTDVLVDFLRGRQAAVDWVTREAGEIAMSVIVLAELLAGARGEEEQRALAQLASLFPVLEVSADVAREGGILKQRYGPSHGMGLADALIAATAEIHGLKLAALNVRHYPMFSGLKPVYRKA